MKKLLSILFALSLLIAPISAHAQGPPADYLDYYRQISNPDPTWLVTSETYTIYRWRGYAHVGLPDTTLQVYAPDYKPIITDAFGRWTSTAGWRQQNQWEYVNYSAANLQITLTVNACGGGGALSCVDHIAWTSAGSPTTGWDVNIPYRQAIYLDSGWLGSNDAKRRGIITHELGHIIGLGEQYTPPSTCNSSVWSIMDACDLVGSGQYYPTTFDTYNVQDYWTGAIQGYQYNGGWVSGSTLSYAWLDKVWPDWMIVTDFWYWNGSTWVGFTTVQTTVQVGTHYDIEPRSLQFNVNPGNYGVHGKYVIGCSYPWLGADGVGVYVCGAQIWYP